MKKFSHDILNEFIIVYITDANRLMSCYIQNMKNQYINVSKIIKRKFLHFDFSYIFSRDQIDSLSDKNEIIQKDNDDALCTGFICSHHTSCIGLFVGE